MPIPRDYLLPFKATYQATWTGQSVDSSFEFPVAIDRDLSSVAMPGVALRVTRSQDSGKALCTYDMMSQVMDFVGIAVANAPLRLQGPQDLESFDIQMSESGKYLMVVHKSRGLIEIKSNTYSHVRLAVVYVDQQKDQSHRPNYRFLKSLAFKPSLDGGDDQADSTMLLHPTLPLVAIKYKSYVVTRSATRMSPEVNGARGHNAGVWDVSSAGKELYISFSI